MVLYFSGTGNSRYVAQRIAAHTHDTLVSINQLMQQGNADMLVSDGRPFVFVCPTYAWRIPRVVDAWIRAARFEGSGLAYFVLTCGGEAANAAYYVERLCRQKGWTLQGFAEVRMPDNYILMFPAADKAKAASLLDQAEPVIAQIAEDIRGGGRFSRYAAKGLAGRLESGVVNAMFYPLFVRAKGFYATDACTGCGQCARLCPLGNVAMQGSQPAWGNRCTHCTACINGCPTVAIEYKNKTRGKGRYWCPGKEPA